MNIEKFRETSKRKEDELKKNIGTQKLKTQSLSKKTMESIHSLKKFIITSAIVIVPYIVGTITITLFCFFALSINFTLEGYITVFLSQYSVFGLWVIGYFLLSIVIALIFFANSFFKRSTSHMIMIPKGEPQG